MFETRSTGDRPASSQSVRFSFDASSLRQAVDVAERLRRANGLGVRVRPARVSGTDTLRWEILVTAAGNAILTRTYQGLRDRQLTILAAQFIQGGERIERAVANHARLLDILRGGTVDELVAETHTHVRSGIAALGVER